MQHPSFESLISAPWPESEESSDAGQAYHLSKHQNQPDQQSNDDEGLEHTVILGYN
ncbi:MAG: hypothetical protein OEY09_07435 [Gammaproteobacteria bacterium]|nr:hypothetical protein [Gammaproteobacteria bacterium]